VIPLAVPDLTGNEARYLAECIDTNFVSSVGPFVDRFESLVAAAVGSAHAVATSSGTTGLHAALTAVGVRRDDLVILPTFTFIASANAIAHCGASPWLFDIGADSWSLDADQVAAGLERQTHRVGTDVIHTPTGRRVAAILPVHTLGLPADMDALTPLARAYGLPTVADAAAAIGARYKGHSIGAIGGDLSVISFNGNKTVTAGGGGAIVTDDETLAARVRHLTTTARRGPGYEHDVIGFNYRMTNLQAAVGCAQLERLDELVGRKRRIARDYARAFQNLPGVASPPDPAWADGSCWLSGFTVRGRFAAPLIDHLRSRGVDARPFWKPIHLQAPYRDAPVYGTMAVAEDVWPGVVTLPCSTALSRAEQDHVIEVVREAMDPRRALDGSVCAHG
jgi:dTDP-4-amino-4,6-dideoxygalactose transaminase